MLLGDGMIRLILAVALCLASALAVGPANAQTVAGAIPNQVAVGSGGDFSYAIPIPVIGGTGGMEPRLSLSYSSQGGPGPAGVGWAIGGYSKVTRGPLSAAVDGQPRAVQLDGDDAYYLDGQRLIPVSTASSGTIEYRKELDDQSRIVATVDGARNPISFRVRTKGGLVLDLGGNGATVNVGGVAAVWMIRRITDTTDNYLDFSYAIAGADFELEAVRYTGHSAAPIVAPYAEVRFDYEAVEAYSVAYLHGNALVKTRRLVSVRTRLLSPGLDVYTLNLGYEATPGAGRFRLKSLGYRASTGEVFQPLEFTYSDPPGNPWIPTAAFQVPAGISSSASTQAFRFARTQAGQPPSLLFAAEGADGPQAAAYEVSGGKWKPLPAAKAPPLPFVDASGGSRGSVVVDFDGDGLDDLIYARNSEGVLVSRAFRQAADHWEEAPDRALSIAIASDGVDRMQMRSLDLDGDGDLDLLGIAPNGAAETIVNTGGKWQSLPATPRPAGYKSGPFLADADCDNKPELTYLLVSDGHTKLVVYRYASGWTVEPGWTQDLGGAADDVNVVATEGNCGSLFVGSRDPKSGAVSARAFVAGAGGWKAAADLAPPTNIFWTALGKATSPRAADLDGDGRIDLIARENWADGTSVDLVYLQLATANPGDGSKWRAANAGGELGSPFRLATDGHPRASVQLRFLDADNRLDLIDLEQRGPGVVGAYLGTGVTWAPAGDFSPPMEFARAGEQDLGLKFVDLNADGLVDVIYNRKLTGGAVPKCADGAADHGAFLNRGNRWECADGYIPPRPFPSAANIAAGVSVVDVNNDGFVDLVYSYRTEGGAVVQDTYLNAYPKGQEGWTPSDATWKTPVVVADERQDSRASFRMADVDGDARVDLIRAYQTYDNQIVTEFYRNTGNGWSAAKRDLPGAFVIYRADFSDFPANVPNQLTRSELIDVDGDHVPEFVERYLDNQTLVEVSSIYRWDGQKYVKTNWTLPVPLDASTRNPKANGYFVDINGDGIQDYYDYDGSSGRFYVGTGAGWVRSAGLDIPAEALSEAYRDAATRFLDLNGDGLADLAYYFATDPGKYRKGAYLNLGDKWVKASDDFAPPTAFLAENGTDLGVRPIDVDGNGVPDMIKSLKTGQDLDQKVWLNLARRADVLVAAQDSQGVTTRITYQALGEYRALTAAEAPERVYEHGKAGSWPNVSIAPAMYVVARLVTDEGNGRQRATRYRYGDLRLDVAWSRSLGFAWKETADEASGLTTRTEFRQDPVMSGLVSAERSSLPSAGTTRLMSEVVNTRVIAPRDGTLRGDGAPYRYWQNRLTTTASRTLDIDGSVLSSDTTTFGDFDAYGNIGRVTIARSDGVQTETTNTYSADAEEAWLGRLEAASVTKTLGVLAPGQICQLPQCEQRRSTFQYEPGSRLLRTETANVDSQKYAVETRYERDPFGNVVRKTIHALANNAPDRVETYRYVGDLGRLLEVVTDASGGRAENRYDDALRVAFGTPSMQIDPNQLRVVRKHDGFGRVVSVQAADGVVRTTRTVALGSIPSEYLAGLDHAGAVRPSSCVAQTIPAWRQPVVGYATLSQVSSRGALKLLPEVVIYDRGGRIIRKAASVYDGSTVRIAFADSEYDDLGRLIGQSLPYFSGQASRWTLIQYDRLGRPIAAISPNGACVQTIYAGLTVTTRTITGKAKPARDKVTTYNQDGAPLAVRDAKGGTVRFTYDAGRRATSITAASGARTEFLFDDGGHRYRLQDPDSGVWLYDYDGFGRLTVQRDPLHGANPRRIKYDVMGRVESVSTSEHVTTWRFRPAGGSCGSDRIDTIETAPVNAGWGPRYRETYAYDSLCRAESTKVDITAAPSGPKPELLPQASYVSRQAYDDFGRVQLSQYPMSFGAAQFSTRNTYQPDTGTLIFVDEYKANDTFGRRLWSLVAADASRRVVKEQRGQELVLTQRYDDNTGAVVQQRGDAHGARLIDIAYQYDLIGNLQTRTDRFGPSQSYRYDELGRLTDVLDPKGVVSQSVRYDEDGRIVSKSDVGFYRYGDSCGAMQPGEAWRPRHAVCGISAAAGSAIVERYQYDQLGQITRSPSANFGFNAENQLERIAHRLPTGAETLFVEHYAYGPKGQLYLEYAEREKTGSGLYRDRATYRLGLYENELRLTGGSKVSVDRYYIRAGGSVIGFVEAADYRKALPGDTPPELASKPLNERMTSRLTFVIKDRLGSVSALLSENGAVLKRFAYDPWGRATPAGSLPVDAANDELAARWSDGFTGHAHLLIGSTVSDLIHMGGRVYDSRLAVFLSPDPIFSDPTYSQDLNPYMYAVGNPLKFTDPTGYGWFSSFFSNPFKAIADLHRNFVNEVGRGLSGIAHWVQSDWREIVGVAVGIVIAVYCPPCMANPIVGGFLIGAAQAGTTTALYGGDSSQVLEAAMRGGATGAIGGAASFAAGSYIQASGFSASSWQAATAHGVAGGVSSIASGGRFESGFVSGAFTQYVTHNTGVEDLEGAPRWAANAAIGGAAAELGGGKFENGARYGAFQNLFNDLLHEAVAPPPTEVRMEVSALNRDLTDGDSFFNFEASYSANSSGYKYGEGSGGIAIDLKTGEISGSASYGPVSITADSKHLDVGLNYGLSMKMGNVGVELATVGVATDIRSSFPNASFSVRTLTASAQVRITPGSAWTNIARNVETAIKTWVCSAGGCGIGGLAY